MPLLGMIPEQMNWQANHCGHPEVLSLWEQTIVNTISIHLYSPVLSLKRLLVHLLKGFFSC